MTSKAALNLVRAQAVRWSSKIQRGHFSSLASDTINVNVLSSLGQGLLLDYNRSWAWQHVLLSRRLASRRLDPDCSDSDCVLMLEHSPVYTLGRGSDENYLTFLDDSSECQQIRDKLSRKARGPGTARLTVDRSAEEPLAELSVVESVGYLANMANPVFAPNNVPIFRVERGGEVTFHGPSQLVVYPLFDLRREPFQQDLHWYLRQVEEVIIRTMHRYGIESARDDINTGVWVGPEKLAAVGVSSSRWITTHGLAINVDPDLDYFDTSMILPCGVEGRGVTSMAKILRERGEPVPTMEEVAKVVAEAIEEVFGVKLQHDEAIH